MMDRSMVALTMPDEFAAFEPSGQLSGQPASDRN